MSHRDTFQYIQRLEVINCQTPGEDVGLKALNLIPAIVGPFLGSFAAWSAWHGFFEKKSQEKAA